MPEEPVIQAATSFSKAMSALAKSAPRTANIGKFLRALISRFFKDYRGKN
jgi:hypothetical protein